ncbi:MAG: archaeosortase/exosortase family protein [Chloroherpetonaceae bacterium]|nr:archaeosortase/exosortase family protein [Chthonomonadaceae bacterium]MDW8207677.1 archaeosortase/exosortase family protein [Chloroherpetonaceae bacterium]
MAVHSSSETDYRFMTPWQCARIRLRALWQSPPVRLEIFATVALFALIFGPELPRWWQRWALESLLQIYALPALLLVPLWLYLNRWRILLPELDNLNERFTETSVIRFLMEEDMEEPKRLRWPLLIAALATPLALFSREPTLTFLACVGLLAAYIGYRHGTFALRVLATPLLFLTTLTPVPGPLMDALLKRIGPAYLRLVTNLLTSFGVNAEVSREGNPIQIPPPPQPPGYELYAGQVGTGFAEAALCLWCSAWWLSLLQASLWTRIRIWIACLLWVGLLCTLRLTLIGALGAQIAMTMDGRDTLGILALITRWLLPIAGLAGQYALLRAFRVQTLHEWIAR